MPPKGRRRRDVNMAASLLKSSAIVSLLTMLSRILGLVRDVAMNYILGANAASDAFFIAWKIPNFFRRLFGEGAFSQAFVPVLAEYHQKRSAEEVKALIDRVAGTLSGVLLGVTLLGVVFPQALVAVFGFGFIGKPEFGLASDLLAITFPYLWLISLTAFAGGILNSAHRYAVPAFTPVFLNLCMLGGAATVLLFRLDGAHTLAWSILIAGLVQLAFQLPFLWRLGFLPRPRWGWSEPGVQRVMKLMLPALFGVSVAQVNLLIDTSIATLLEDGSVAWLYNADRLLELPLGLFGVGVATVILPVLAKQFAREDLDDFSHTIDWAARSLIILGAPATVGLILLSEPMMLTLFQHEGGRFTARDATMSAWALNAYALGLCAHKLIKVFATGYTARQRLREPVRIGVIAMIANMVFVLGLAWPFTDTVWRWGFEAFGVPVSLRWPLGHVGNALALTLSATLNCWLLYRGLRRDGCYRPESAFWGRWLGRITLAAGLMGLALWVTDPGISVWLDWPFWRRCLELGWRIVLGAAVYGGLLVALGLRKRDLRGVEAR
ncbi:MAG: murein biosynthesis integral membrane protein MurJ [Gammaproteobacteria bacterium]|nr:murein biosynthesis integral membrane protein MurJ [Gammaproteobacteria bacterium]